MAPPFVDVPRHPGGDMPGIFLARPAPVKPGVRLAVKDVFDTAGLATTYGSALFADHVPTATAEAVRLLEAAGYANVGKTNLHELGYGVTSLNPHFGHVPNPLALGRIAGGSSGGSAAALAAGLADAALGTDAGGSIRIPAACCGVVGFKPTFGRVPVDGCFALTASYDHAGPMARRVGDCTAMMNALVPGFQPAEPVALAELTAGVGWLGEADPLVRRRVEAAASCFDRRRDLDLPLPQGIGAVFMREVATIVGPLYAEHADSFGPDVGRKLERCLQVGDAEHDRALARRAEYRERWLDACAGVDVVVTPTLASVAPEVARAEDDEVSNALIRFTYPLNVVGWPALALPCGPAEHGLPASVQVVGRPGDDALVLAVGEALERALASLV
jgi:aspartyl-tRNA(Asn)/glutamyl-tRNA(Gln) amidotransferase subunit A